MIGIWYQRIWDKIVFNLPEQCCLRKARLVLLSDNDWHSRLLTASATGADPFELIRSCYFLSAIWIVVVKITLDPVFSNACAGPIVELEYLIMGMLWRIVMRNQRKQACNKVDHKAGGKRRLHTCHPFKRILDDAVYDGGGPG
jgi:hypothetical protein